MASSCQAARSRRAGAFMLELHRGSSGLRGGGTFVTTIRRLCLHSHKQSHRHCALWSWCWHFYWFFVSLPPSVVTRLLGGFTLSETWSVWTVNMWEETWRRSGLWTSSRPEQDYWLLTVTIKRRAASLINLSLGPGWPEGGQTSLCCVHSDSDTAG